MIFHLEKLLNQCRKRISGGPNYTPANPTIAPIEDPCWLAQDGGSKPDGVPFDTVRTNLDEAPLRRPPWDRFFNSLLNPQAMPRLYRSTSAGSNGHGMTADDEDMTHLFAGSAVVETLKAQLNKVPEIRQQRVDSLKQAITERRYQIHPQQVAAAMIADGALSLD
jgi:flagellar biosynthesis anti-sigma factor FlgM